MLFNIILAVLRVLLVRRNLAKRTATQAVDVSEAQPANDKMISHANAFEDLTDKENPDFRYDF